MRDARPGQEARRPERRTDQRRQKVVEQGRRRVLHGRREPGAEAGFPRRRLESAERRHHRRVQEWPPRLTAPADHPALGRVEGDVPRPDRPPTAPAPVKPGPVTQHVQETEGEGELHPSWCGTPVQSAEPSEEEGEAHWLGVALGREARHRLDHPRSLTEALEVLAQAPERLAHVEVVHLHQRSPLAFEADQVAPGEQLQRPGESLADPACAPDDGREAAMLAGEEGDEPIVLAEVPGLENDPLGSEERHPTFSGGPLVTELAQHPVILPPVAPHADAEIEEDADSEERLELPPRGLAHPLEHCSALPDDDALLGRPLDEDLSANVEGGVRAPIGGLIHPDGAGIRHFLPHREEELFPDGLGDEERLGLIGHRVGGVQRRAQGEEIERHCLEPIDTRPGLGRDRHERPERIAIGISLEAR